MNWSKKFPKKAGNYWFYGYRFKLERGKVKKKFHFVEVRKISNGFLIVTEGHFLNENEAQGVFCKAVLPDIPSDNEQKYQF